MACFRTRLRSLRCALSVRLHHLAIAASLGYGLVLTSPAHAQKAAAVSDEARRHFNAGVALLRDPDGARYEEAYREFKVAYEASGSWKVLGNLGLAAMKLERDGEAIRAFERYLVEGGKEIDPAERADIERDLATLKSSAVTVSLRFKPVDAVLTDERTPVQGAPIRNRYQSESGTLSLKIRPGHHVMTASIAGKPPLTFEFDAEPGTAQQHEFDFDAASNAAVPQQPVPAAAAPQASSAPSAGRPVPTSVWIGLAATGVLAAGAGASGAIAIGKKNDFDQANGRNPDEAKDLHGQTKTMNLVTDVLIGAAIVGAGVTTYLYLKRPEREQAGFTLRLQPQASLERTSMSLEGTF